MLSSWTEQICERAQTILPVWDMLLLTVGPKELAWEVRGWPAAAAAAAEDDEDGAGVCCCSWVPPCCAKGLCRSSTGDAAMGELKKPVP